MSSALLRVPIGANEWVDGERVGPLIDPEAEWLGDLRESQRPTLLEAVNIQHI